MTTLRSSNLSSAQSLAIRVGAIFPIYAKGTAALARVAYRRSPMKISDERRLQSGDRRPLQYTLALGSDRGLRRSAIPIASSVTLITRGTQSAVLFCIQILQALEAAMSNTFMNWTSRVAIAGRIAGRRHLQNCNERPAVRSHAKHQSVCWSQL